MIGSEETTASSGAAGAAFGAIIGWGISVITGVDTAPIVGSLAVVGAFAFGRIFGP